MRTCKRCGGSIVQEGRGRPREWCSLECKRANEAVKDAAARVKRGFHLGALRDYRCRRCDALIVAKGSPLAGRSPTICRACKPTKWATPTKWNGLTLPLWRTCVGCPAEFVTVYVTKARCSKGCGMDGRASASTRASRLLDSARRRADQKGLAFTLTHADIAARIARGSCEVTGIPFDLRSSATGKRATHISPWAPSIDRINPFDGYTSRNVQVVCAIYNQAKGQGTHEDVLALARALGDRQPSPEGNDTFTLKRRAD